MLVGQLYPFDPQDGEGPQHPVSRSAAADTGTWAVRARPIPAKMLPALATNPRLESFRSRLASQLDTAPRPLRHYAPARRPRIMARGPATLTALMRIHWRPSSSGRW